MFAFAHLIGAWLLGKGYECGKKQVLPHTAWFFLLFGALLPDADFIIDWTLETELHRTFTHSLFFVLFVPLIVYVLFQRSPDKKMYALSSGLGILSHLLLDLGGHGVPLLWPSLLHFSINGLTFFDPAAPSFLHSSSEGLRRSLRIAIIDMALGTGWLFWLWWKKRIKF